MEVDALKLQGWLDVIATKATKSPVIVVGTHRSELRGDISEIYSTELEPNQQRYVHETKRGRDPIYSENKIRSLSHHRRLCCGIHKQWPGTPNTCETNGGGVAGTESFLINLVVDR